MGQRTKQRMTHTMILLTLGITALVAGVLILMGLSEFDLGNGLVFAEGLVLTVCAVLLAYFWVDPDTVRADQTEEMLNLSSETLALLADGLDQRSAQRICCLLLPVTKACAVAITDTTTILGYEGVNKENNPSGSPVRTQATHRTLADGKTRVLRSAEQIGFPDHTDAINAAIIVPLTQGATTVGTLKFYYARARSINDTQRSVSTGFAELLSSQIAAASLDEQRKLATSMELKALQSQINPHFLYNTINTISSFTRTDPDKARVLLREFASFYRSTLEDSSDLIALKRELDQTRRYLHFEIARFGEDRLSLDCEVPDDLDDVLVPAFLVQPLVENAVKHAMRPEGCLHVRVAAVREGDDLRLTISDDGVGMSPDQAAHITNADSSTGLGVAVKNIHDRVRNYYGASSYMSVDSQLGKGTEVTLFLKDGCAASTYARLARMNGDGADAGEGAFARPGEGQVVSPETFARKARQAEGAEGAAAATGTSPAVRLKAGTASGDGDADAAGGAVLSRSACPGHAGTTDAEAASGAGSDASAAAEPSEDDPLGGSLAHRPL